MSLYRLCTTYIHQQTNRTYSCRRCGIQLNCMVARTLVRDTMHVVGDAIKLWPWLTIIGLPWLRVPRDSACVQSAGPYENIQFGQLYHDTRFALLVVHLMCHRICNHSRDSGYIVHHSKPDKASMSNWTYHVQVMSFWKWHTVCCIPYVAKCLWLKHFPNCCHNGGKSICEEISWRRLCYRDNLTAQDLLS